MALTLDLGGKRALVTGGSRGIGRAVCERLAQAGARVAFSFRDEAAAQATMSRIAAHGGEGLPLRSDLDEPDAPARLVAQAVQAAGGLDILVANAGIWEPGPLEDLTPERLQRTWRVNVDALVQTCRSGAAAMRRAGGGRIVAIGSTAGQRGEAGYAQYAASKGAVHLFVQSIAVELAPHGINVNTVAPGWVMTDMTRHVLEGPDAERLAREIPRGRPATPDEVAGPVVFLCSELADHMVGACVNVNGGSVM